MSSPMVENHGAFTLALIEALVGIDVQRQDGYVCAREVAPEWKNGRQHQVLNFEDADNFIVAYYAVGDTKPKGLPFNIESEIEPTPRAWTNIDQSGMHGWRLSWDTAR